MIALAAKNRTAPKDAGSTCVETPSVKTLGVKTPGGAKKKIRVRAKKNEIAAGSPASGAWRRWVIDF
jgi:hypothetical protein